MEMNAYTICDKEENNLGMELQVVDFFNKNHYLSIFVNKDFDLNCIMFNNSIVDNSEDLVISVGDKKPANICKEVLKNRNLAYYKFNGGEDCIVLRREKFKQNEVSCYYVYVAKTADLKLINLPEENIFTKDDVRKFVALFRENCDHKLVLPADEYCASIYANMENKSNENVEARVKVLQ